MPMSRDGRDRPPHLVDPGARLGGLFLANDAADLVQGRPLQPGPSNGVLPVSSSYKITPSE